MSNLHATAASVGQAVVTTAETVIATLGPFNVNNPGDQAQGVAFSGNINMTIGTGGTSVTVRIRRTSIAGTVVGLAQVVTVTAAALVNIPIADLDPVFLQPAAVYVITVAVAGASANSTINRVVFEAQEATAFE